MGKRLVILAIAGVLWAPWIFGQVVDLHDAAAQGDVESVRLLLEHGDDPNLMDKRKQTPLHLAARNGHVEAARLLLDNGADPNVGKKIIRPFPTALHLAAEYGQAEVATLLLERGADPNAHAAYGVWTGRVPLQVAAKHENLDVAYVLLKNGAELSWPMTGGKFQRKLLRLAVRKGHRELATYIENPVKQVPTPTPLHAAAGRGDVDTVRRLLENGADPNDRNMATDQMTPLHAAAAKGHLETARLLLDNGADPDGELKFSSLVKFAPLHLAAEHNHAEVAELLFERGAKPNPKANYGLGWSDLNLTPLHIAYRHESLDVAYVLLKNGAALAVGKETGPEFQNKLLRLAMREGHKDLEFFLAGHVGRQVYDDVNRKGNGDPDQVAAAQRRLDEINQALANRKPQDESNPDADALKINRRLAGPRPQGASDERDAAKKRLDEIMRGLVGEDRQAGNGRPGGCEPEPIGEDLNSPDSRLRAVREWMMDYGEALPDFVCTQFAQSFTSYWGGGWQKRQEVVAKVQIVDGRESYKTVSVDAVSSNETYLRASGGESGHFASVLYHLLHPGSKARFDYSREDITHGRPVDVFKVFHPKAGYTLHLGVKRNGKLKKPIRVGYAGEIHVDKNFSVVVRMIVERFVDIPRKHPLQDGTLQIDYGSVEIGGKPHWMPVEKTSTWTGKAGTDYAGKGREYMIWTNCEKFTAETKLSFEGLEDDG